MNSVKKSLPRQLRVGQVLAASGATALVLGLIFMIAFNWEGLPSFAKFGLIQSLIAILALGALWRGLGTTIGKGLLVMAIGCIGPLLAVFGQTYQTGADVWQLFFSWALLGLIWAFASRSAGGWLLWIILAQAALWLRFHTYFDLSLFRIGSVPLWAAVGAVNGALLVAWELAADRYQWLTGRFAPRLIAGVLVFALTVATVYAIATSMDFESEHPMLGWICAMLAGYLWYARGQRDIVITTFCWVSTATVVLALVIRLLIKADPILAVFAGFIALLGSLVIGVKWLRKNFSGANHWIVDVAAGLGAWLAMIFLLLLVLLMFGESLYRSSVFWFVVCALCFGAALALSRTTGDSVFAKQLMTVLSLAAPTAIYQAINAHHFSNSISSNDLLSIYAASAVALVLWCFLSSKQTRSLLALVVMFAVAAVMEQFHLDNLAVWVYVVAACAIWLLAPNSFLIDEQAIARAAEDVRIHRLTEFGYAASLWAVVIGISSQSNGPWSFLNLFSRSQSATFSAGWAAAGWWLPSFISFVVATVVYAGIAKGTKKPLLTDILFAILMVGCIALSAFYIPYLLAFVTLLALGFSTERTKLSALAILGTIASLFQYYFEQATPLWMKGCVLFALGTLLLIAAWRATQKQPEPLRGAAQ
jgi:uncharacterized membrane protein